MSDAIREINLKVCQMLGLKETERVSAVDIRLRPREFPRITVTRFVTNAQEFEELTQTFRLELVETAAQGCVGAANVIVKAAAAGDGLEA